LRLLQRISGAHANHRRIATGALTIGVLTILAKIFVAGREVAIAWRYGISGTVDAYQLAFTIVTWVPMLLTGIMAVVLVPRLVSLDRRKYDRQPFLREFNATILVLGAAVAAITFLAAPFAAHLMASRLHPETVTLTIRMVRWLSPVALFMIVSGYFTARLQAKERFGYTATEAVPALSVAVLVAGPFLFHDALPLIIGAVVGHLVQTLVLARLVGSSDPPFGTIAFTHVSPEWPAFYRSILVMAFGQLVITITMPIDQVFAGRLGEGAVATLGYATRMIALFTGLATVVIGRALLPVLSGAVADGERDLGRRQVLQWTMLMFAAGTLISVSLWTLMPELVKLLFQRGAFQANATLAVTSVTRFGIVQLPFYFAGIALVQWIAATGRYSELLAINAAALVVKVTLNLVLVPLFGLGGIMVATAAMYFATAGFLMLKVAGERVSVASAKAES
jgi:putative peptidoglycan lipid II flippase